MSGVAAILLLLGLNIPAAPEAPAAPTQPVAAQGPAAVFPPVPQPWKRLGPQAPGADAAVKINPSAYHKGHGPNTGSRVVLTYDDCPRSVAEYRKVLAYAKAANIGLVIAPTGECHKRFLARHGTDIALLARQHGQYVINHSLTHANLTKVGYAKAKTEISGEVRSDYGRPPYGARNATVDRAYAGAGMRQWLWDIDTNDWRGKSRAQVVGYVVAHACKGCTVLMHLQHKGFDVTAIAGIKSGLEARGLFLCRAYRGWDNAGTVLTAPVRLGDNALPC